VKPGCETFLCHDIIRSANAYSTMAGVLASVAFLGIVFLLESQHFSRLLHRFEAPAEAARSTTGVENVSVSFITAFLNLIIATFLYAALAGEDVLGPRAGTLGFIAAIALAVAFLNLLYGAVWLFETWELGPPANVTRVIAALIAPGVAFAFVAIRGLDMLSLREGSRSTRSWVGVLLLVLLCGLVVLYGVCASEPGRRFHARWLAGQKAVQATTYTALAVGILTVAGTAAVSELGDSYAIPRWGVAISMVALFMVFAAFILVVGAVHRHGDAA
jgi:hypothetical protein